MRSRTERLAAGVLAAAVLVAGVRHELGWARGGGAAAVVEPAAGILELAIPVDLMTIASTTSSKLEERTRLVVRDSAALAAAWPALALGTPPPTVDFERALVVIVASGRRPTGGHAIGVDSASRAGDTLRVHVATSGPADGCLVTQALTAPAAAVLLDDTAPALTFVETTRTRAC